MNEKRALLIGMIIGVPLGWILVFLLLPFVDRGFPFFIGFIAMLGFLSMGLILLMLFKKNKLLIQMLDKISFAKEGANLNRTHKYIWISASSLVILGAIFTSFLISHQIKLSSELTQDKIKQTELQIAMLESFRTSNLVFLMSNILDKVDDELQQDTNRTLSEETISRIAALSYSFRPYRYFGGDTLSKHKFSPERGQLLLALTKMNIDSASFSKIISETSFSGSDLSGADLKGANLKGIDLIEANLKDANLKGIILSSANLGGANLWGTNLQEAILDKANLKLSDLRWAEMNGVDLQEAELNGALLSDTKLRNANLRKAILQWADLKGAILNGADFRDADLEGANLINAQLDKSDLRGAEVIKIEIEGKDWLKLLEARKIKGAKSINERYKIIKDRFNRSKFMLEDINK